MQQLGNAIGDTDAGWQSDSDEEEFFRREAEQQIGGEGGGGACENSSSDNACNVISSFVDNLSVE
jgi:hypothetical protein